ncbi:hypothetical protein JXA12_02005 [Candidatus Woesearchaeota archaeon]|nr:hypothetical protein [Candidatus Woesearchaeota archaeon]
MGLSNRKEEQLRKMPVIESRLSKSKDGKYLIHRTVITHVRPVAYYKAVLEDAEQVEVEDMPDVAESSA